MGNAPSCTVPSAWPGLASECAVAERPASALPRRRYQLQPLPTVEFMVYIGFEATLSVINLVILCMQLSRKLCPKRKRQKAA